MNTFNELVKASFTQINDEVYCSLVDIGLDPAAAYKISYIDIPMDDLDVERLPEINLSEDVDDVALIDL